MAAYFISQGEAEMPRWRKAFSDAQVVSPDDASTVGEGDCAWVMSSLANWQTLVRDISRRGAHVAVLTYRPDAEEALQALKVGARGYAHALAAPAVLCQVRTVISHQGIWVPAELMARVVSSTFRRLNSNQEAGMEELNKLTERERAVAEAVLEGLTNKEVARKLEITERTVKAHLGAVFQKLGVKDRIQLVLLLSGRSEGAVEARSRTVT